MSFLRIWTCIVVLLLVGGLRQQKCRILALEGGGTKGAYHAGAFKAMAEHMKATEIQYDVISGASVGALNGMLIASYEKGREKVAADKLMEFWTSITRTDIYYHWPFGPLEGLLTRSSFLDNSPILPYLQKKFKEIGGLLKRKFSIGILDAQTMDYLIVDEKVDPKLIPYYITASASVPGIFPYIDEGNRVLIDGGSTDNLNLKGAISKCKEIVGENEAAIIIDSIMTNTYDARSYNLSKANTIDFFYRGKDLREQAQTFWYLNDSIRAHPKIHWRYLILPKEDLPNYPGIGLSFDPETLRQTREIGYKDAKQVITRGRGNYVEMVRGKKLEAGSSYVLKRRSIEQK